MDRDTYVACPSLPPGNYQVFVKMDWNENTAKHLKDLYLNINCYGCESVTFTQNKSTDTVKFLEKVMFAKAKEHEEEFQPISP